MQRSAPRLRRGALLIRGPWVPALRCIVKNAAPRPGHEPGKARLRATLRPTRGGSIKNKNRLGGERAQQVTSHIRRAALHRAVSRNAGGRAEKRRHAAALS